MNEKSTHEKKTKIHKQKMAKTIFCTWIDNFTVNNLMHVKLWLWLISRSFKYVFYCIEVDDDLVSKSRISYLFRKYKQYILLKATFTVEKYLNTRKIITCHRNIPQYYITVHLAASK